ncbi:MAG: glycosyltransferase 9 family protein [Rhodospirillaceae bacterium]|nr:glycosyltransferase 9 family protein [Rhodospirillaceae bacterium]
MKVLFITSTRIGDAVLSTGILKELIQSHPNIDITIACGPAAAPIFSEMPRLKKLVAMEKKVCSLHWFDLWKICIGIKWDIIVDLRNSPVSRMLFARRRYVMRRVDPSIHRVQQLGDVMGMRSSPPSPFLWTSDRQEEAAQKIIEPKQKVLALGAMANWKGKEWKLERFSELAFRLTQPGGILAGASVVILGSKAELPRSKIVLEKIPAEKRVNLVGKIDLLTAYAVLRRSSLFVGNDSGLMHMAAASGIPTLGLFGPSKEAHYGPWGSKSAWIRTPKTYDELVGEPGYDHRNTGSLMSSLSVDQVEEAAITLWGQHRRAVEK